MRQRQLRRLINYRNAQTASVLHRRLVCLYYEIVGRPSQCLVDEAERVFHVGVVQDGHLLYWHKD